MNAQPDFRTLFEAAPASYLVLAPDLTIVAASDAYLAATMTTREGVLGRELFEVFPDNPDDPAAPGNLRASLRRVLATAAPDTMPLQKYDIRRPQSDGGGFEEHYRSPINSPVRGPSGEIAYIIHRVEDVTDYVRLEQRRHEQQPTSDELGAYAESMESRARAVQDANELLRLANEHPAGRATGVTSTLLDVTTEQLTQERFRIAVEASPSAMLIVDHNGVIVFANSQAEHLFLYSREELVGTCVDALTPKTVQPTHVQLRESFFAAPSRRKLGAGRELSGARKDGTEIPLEIALAPVQLDNGIGVLVSLVDITERHELMARLAQSDRLAAVGELAAGVAHEINNPLNTMINCAQLVIDGDDMNENCRTILQEGARIATIVRDLLQFARDDRGRPQPTVLADVVARTVRLMGESMKRNGINLEVDLPSDLPPVFANPDQLQQVLLNLVINAKDALQHDASREQRCVRISARVHANGSVRCSVRDNGPGISPELGARIFEPFVTTKRARGGTGLGLSISRSIVESFGGTLAVDSVTGEFSDFWFVLPEPIEQDDAPRGHGPAT